jgi:hypothetical protein
MVPNINTFDASASTTSPVVAPVAPAIVKTPKTVEEMVKEYFKDSPIMTKIAWCESRNRQFEKDGKTVYTGRIDADDTGVMQINKYYHLKTATKLGINLDTVEGNMAYAKYLYEKEGTVPWNSSSKCWKAIDTTVAKN